MKIDVVNLSYRPRFNIGPYEIVSQQPFALKGPNRSSIVESWLPVFLYTWREIERLTGHRWRNTSYIRESPSHSLGQSFDIAPDIDPSAQRYYGVFKGSDPILYKRRPLVRALQSLNFESIDPYFSQIPSRIGIGLFIESDHIHIQILSKDEGAQLFSVVKWGIAKPLYKDTYERKVLPFTDVHY